MQQRHERTARVFISLALVSTLSTGSMSAQSMARARHPLSAATVAVALRLSGLDVQPSRVHLPMALSSASASPGLEIISTERVAGDRIRLRLRCQHADDCVPFYATVDLAGDTASADVLMAKPLMDGIPQVPKGLDVAAGTSQEQHTRSVSQQIASLPSVWAGDRVVLIIQDGHMRIHLPAIALDTGAAGREIRVCTEDHKKTFRATVLDENTVRGALQ